MTDTNYNTEYTATLEYPAGHPQAGQLYQDTLFDDLSEFFHPLEGSTKAPVTGITVNGKDLNEIFEPVASGKPVDAPTGYRLKRGTATGSTDWVQYVNSYDDLYLAYNQYTGEMTKSQWGENHYTTHGSSEGREAPPEIKWTYTDLQDVFAAKNSLAVELKLQQLPRGAFGCRTFFSAWYDTSGSMNQALSYIIPAVDVITSYFTAVFNASGRVYQNSTTNEYCLNWIGAAVDNTGDPPEEVTIAFINESDSGGLGDPNIYKNRWKAVTGRTGPGDSSPGSGGIKYGAIGGVTYNAYYPNQIRSALEGDDGLAKYGVSGFFDISNTTPTSAYVQMIVEWLNIPTTPDQLEPETTPFESGQHTDRVQWDLSALICGLAHEPSSFAAGYSRTQQDWQVEITSESGDVLSVESFDHLPTRYTYQPPVPTNGLTFGARLIANGVSGYNSGSSQITSCNLQDSAPVLTLIGSSTVTV